MPIVRISLPNHLKQIEIDNISNSVHQSLVKYFNIPDNDIFHIIDKIEPNCIKYPLEFEGLEHSKNMIFIFLNVVVGRTKEQKQSLFKSIAQKIEKSTSISINDVIILINESHTINNWSLGAGISTTLNHLK